MERWLSAGIGFLGVMIVAGCYYDLIMLGSAPLSAISAPITKALTKRDKAEVIVVWPSISIGAISAPRTADAPATQSVKFFDLVWMTGMGFLAFNDVPMIAGIIGGLPKV